MKNEKTFRNAAEQYIHTLAGQLIKHGLAPNEHWTATTEALYDFADNMDRQAIIVMKKKVKV